MRPTRYAAAGGSVPRVPNKRKPGQTMLTFWLPDAEAEAARAAIAHINATKPEGTPDTTVTGECRRALRNLVKRAEKKRQETDQ